MSQHQTFSSLPYELMLNIISFGAGPTIDLSDHRIRSSQVKFVANFQSLNSKFNSIKEMKDFYDEFWWNAFESYFGKISILFKEVNRLKDLLSQRNELKRKILLAIYIKNKYKSNSVIKQLGIDNELKIAMIGEGGVGKSSLTLHFIQGLFQGVYDPTIEDSYRKVVNIDNKSIMLDVLDTAGPEEYPSLRESYLRAAGGFLAVSSVTDTGSLIGLHPRIRQLVGVKDREHNDMPIVFSINKIDLLNDSNREKVIGEYRKEIKKIIKEFKLCNVSIVETSAKTGENLSFLFEQIVRNKLCGSYDSVLLLNRLIDKDVAYLDQFKDVKKSCQVM